MAGYRVVWVGGLLLLLVASSVVALSLPVVVSVDPANDVRDVAVAPHVSATFSKPMNPSTITEQSFVLRQRTTPESSVVRERVVKGTVVYDEQSMTATFVPDKRLKPGQEFGNVFTATITTAVRDTDGYALEHPYVWSFTTGDDRYNTDASTSQQNSTASEVPAPVIDDESNQSAPAVAPPQDDRSAGLGVWPIAALVLGVLLLALLFFFALSNRSRDEDDALIAGEDADLEHEYVYPVQEVEGIGPAYAKKLQQAGILDTAQLVAADAADVAKLLSVGARSVRSWQKRADLMMVRGVGKQYAELLERSGVHSVEDLAVARPERLLADVREKQEGVDVSIQGREPSKRIVSSWIDSARSHQQRRSGKT